MDPSGNARPGGRISKPDKGNKKTNKVKPLYLRFPKDDPNNPSALWGSIAQSHRCRENRERKQQKIVGYKSMIEEQDEDMAGMKQQMAEKDETNARAENEKAVIKTVLKVLAPEFDIASFIQGKTVITVLSPATVVISQATSEVVPTSDLMAVNVDPYPVAAESAAAAAFQDEANHYCEINEGSLFHEEGNGEFQYFPAANLLNGEDTVATSNAGNLVEQCKVLSLFETFNFVATEDSMNFGDVVAANTLASLLQSDDHPIDLYFQEEEGVSHSNGEQNLEEQANDLSEMELDCTLDFGLPAVEDSIDLSGIWDEILVAVQKDFPTFMESPNDQN